MFALTPPPVVATEVFASLPERFRRTGVASPWAESNRGGQPVDSFLEGPSFDRDGNLYVVDIPFGRVFKISPDGQFHLVAEYDGQPNGLKIHKDGRIFIADYKRGILLLDPERGTVSTVLSGRHSEAFKGCNDLVFSSAGDLYFTDQGQTGLHDPTGRVYRLTRDGRLDCLIDNVPSPNGLVLVPQENVLMLAVTRANCVWRLPLQRDGSVSKVGLYIQLSGGRAGPDGLAMGENGELCLCQTGMGTVWVFDPLGQPIARIASCRGLGTTNCAFGGPDNRDLYITESDTGCVLRARLEIKGRTMFSHMD